MSVERLFLLPLSSANPGRSLSHARMVGFWLWCVSALVFAMVVVGGATRLTQSGLSIVEWNPVMGVVPPLGQADWQAAFDRYKTIPQYTRVNRGMSLDEFKTIYWWEWGHRLLGRLTGAALLVPLIWFWWRRVIDRRLGMALCRIFALGAVQGGVGWWMVSSGLAERVTVSQYRLAFHLTLACIIYAALVWTADQTMEGGLGAPKCDRDRLGTTGPGSCIRFGAFTLVLAVIAQIYLGALVAGVHAGLIYNTWPLIDGYFVPPVSSLMFDVPWWSNFFENTLTVQFDHRMLAYGVAMLALAQAVIVGRRYPGGSLALTAGFVMMAVVVQALIGISTLLHGAPLFLALLHQATALVVLTAAILHARRVWSDPVGRVVPAITAASNID
jgi:cytochrome c oxidase assembly protein subunit 15